jgi:Tfp pilus assembly protein PilN
MDHYAVLARLVSAVLSWLDAANLRNQMYSQRERIEILETALEDIDRINASTADPEQRQQLIAGVVDSTLPK